MRCAREFSSLQTGAQWSEQGTADGTGEARRQLGQAQRRAYAAEIRQTDQ